MFFFPSFSALATLATLTVTPVVRKHNADMLAAEAEQSDASEQEFVRPPSKKSKTKIVLDEEEESLDLALGGGSGLGNDEDIDLGSELIFVTSLIIYFYDLWQTSATKMILLTTHLWEMR
jgi:hypothetical protein